MNLLLLLQAPWLKNNALRALLAALLLCLGWWVHPLFLLPAFAPLLAINTSLPSRKGSLYGWRFVGWCYLTFFLWNLGTTWWIYNSTLVGAALAIVLNAALMCIPMGIYRLIARRGSQRWAQTALPALWLLFEFVHLRWDLSWSWLNLGNAFAMATDLVQWYEVTGTLGGTLWVLICSVLTYRAFIGSRRALQWLIPVALTPIVVSLLWRVPGPAPLMAQVVIVQPNIDPYLEKFAESENALSEEEQVARFIQLSESKITPKTQFVLWPETALARVISEDNFEGEPLYQQLQAWTSKHPQLALLTGATTIHEYASKEEASPTARHQGDRYYDIYNTAIKIQAGQDPQFYHKSKLVPGVEQLPFPTLFNPVADLVFNLGGASGSLGKQDSRVAFGNGSAVAAPVICYESVYGDFCADYVKNGANFLAVITNDGWWGVTPGHRQHLAYAKLRAIELRKDIARSANTGISAVIRADGEVEETLAYNTMGAMQANISLHEGRTFYARYGDYLGWLALVWLLIALRYTRRPERWRRRMNKFRKAMGQPPKPGNEDL